MRILLVEDDEPVAGALTARLHRHGYEVVMARTAEAALHWLDGSIDVVLLDLGLPGQDGMKLCPRIRQASDAAILIVTARDAPESRVQGLDIGADDYIVKPYDTRELLARINAVVRRRSVHDPSSAPAASVHPAPVRIDGIDLDVAGRMISIKGTPVELTRCEFDILVLLARQPGVVATYDRIAHELWHSSWPGVARALHVHVARLRNKIGIAGLIQTVRGVGYRLRDR